jgi:oligopeptidase A
MTNPLLESHELPPFTAMRPEHIEPAIRQLLGEQRACLAALLDSNAGTWDTLIVPLEEMKHRLATTWSPIFHLNGVANTDEWRAAYNACLPLLTAWNTDLTQNERLFLAYKSIFANEGGRLMKGQRKLLENALRDFRLAGVGLPPERKDRFKALMEQLAVLQSKFDENVLDATRAWSRRVIDAEELKGLPAVIIERGRAAAQVRGLGGGWLFALDDPNYQAILTHAENQALRREFYEAWMTRASDQGPLGGCWDNTELMSQILASRHELATLVGYPNYGEYSLATKMASSVDEVRQFIEQLAARSKPIAQREFEELSRFAGHTLNAWDVAFYSERFKRETFSVSQEALRPYFPLPRVLAGVFAVAERLYSLRIVERSGVDVYHPDIRFYDILNADDSPRAGLFIDLYARDKKRGHAWMDVCVGRKHLNAVTTTLPVAYIICNFMPPSDSQPSLLTHAEVVTLIHEFGHALHHMLTQVDYPSIAGFQGVAWDVVELPSQFMENFVWRPEVLSSISAHVDTGEPLSQIELQRLLDSRTFQAGMQCVRQLEFALFDLRIHSEYTPETGARIMPILDEVRAHIAVVKHPGFNRFAHGFQHIFSGSYAAGYYSYKWAEVLSADAFSAFEEEGIFSAAVSHRFLSSVLEVGGSCDAMDAFVEFRGRKPTIEPLLRQYVLAAEVRAR